MHTRSKTFFAFALAALLLLGSTSNVQAKNKGHDDDHNNKKEIKTMPFKMKLEIGFSGKAHISGTVQSVSGSTFTLKSWGGLWTVTTASSTKFTQKGSTLTTLRVGDNVQIKGKLATSSPSWTIAASEVKNKSYKKDRVTNPQATTTNQTTLKLGTVANIGNSSVGIKLQNGSLFTILTSGITNYFDHRLQSIASSSLSVGHSIAAYGTTTSPTSLQAAIIHDLSL